MSKKLAHLQKLAFKHIPLKSTALERNITFLLAY